MSKPIRSSERAASAMVSGSMPMICPRDGVVGRVEPDEALAQLPFEQDLAVEHGLGDAVGRAERAADQAVGEVAVAGQGAEADREIDGDRADPERLDGVRPGATYRATGDETGVEPAAGSGVVGATSAEARRSTLGRRTSDEYLRTRD